MVVAESRGRVVFNREFGVVEKRPLVPRYPRAHGDFEVGLRSRTTKMQGERKRFASIRRIDPLEHEDFSRGARAAMVVANNATVPSQSAHVSGE